MLNWHVIVSGLVVGIAYAAGGAIIDYLAWRSGQRIRQRLDWGRR